MSGIKKSASPVRRGEVVEVEIFDLTHDGEGVGRAGGFTLFVPDTAPGDRVEARVISVQKAYARAMALSFKNRSEDRTDPACGHFTRCGGCQLQHLRYDAQLRLKQKRVADAVRRLGRVEVPVRPVIGMANPWAYRNKAQVPVAAINGRIVAGFYEKRSHRVVNIDTCPIQHPGGFRAVEAARSALRELRIPPYDEQTHCGIVRHILSRVSFSTGEVLLALITNGEKLPHADRLVEILRDRIDNLAGIVQNINSRRGNAVLGHRERTLWGRPFLEEQLGGLTFRFSPRSFFQVNPAQAEVLYEKVLAYAGLTGRQTVFDLYCGTGSIALFLARHARWVVGVESAAQAVEDARTGASINGIVNAEFHAGRAEEVMPRLLREGYRADAIVVDPPRKGCMPALLQGMTKASPHRIVYVSCNPATLARDLKFLHAGGYAAAEIQPVDMFPHTAHVEAVCLLERVSRKK